jgi:hypothetical protein
MATVEAAKQKVERILATAFRNVLLTEDGFKIELGSTAVFILVKDFGTDSDGNPSSIVHLWAPVARGLVPTPEFYHWAATDGRSKYFGGITVTDRDDGTCNVVFDQAILADYLDPAELTSAISMVLRGADEFDDIVQSRFGGKRYADA